MTKILFVTNHLQYNDGTAKALLNLANNLDYEKYSVNVCALFKFDKNFVSLFSKEVNVFGIFKFYFRGFKKLLKLGGGSKFLLKKILKDDYDVVIAFQHGMPTEIISKCDLPKIAVMHGYTTEDIIYHKHYDKIVCVSEFASVEYKKIVDFKDNVTYCHNVFEIEKIINQSKQKIDLDLSKYDKPVFCYVGRLSPEKGIERTLKIFSDIKNRGLKFTYMIVGDGPLRKQLENLTKKLDLQDNVIFCGLQTNPFPYVKKCDCFLLSSFAEGLNTACIEASILGKDIISTNVCGASEIILEPAIGYVSNLDDDSLKKAIIDYINKNYDFDLWNKNKKSNNQKWDKGQTAKRFENIIEEVLKNRIN